MNNKHFISIKRTVGLGNLFLLLPVLDKMSREGVEVELVTRKEWVSCFQALRPDFRVRDQSENNYIDLDLLTKDLAPSRHRTDEFGALLGIEGPFEVAQLHIPGEWSVPFQFLANAIALAPEASNIARQWQYFHWQQLAERLTAMGKLVLLGTNTDYRLKSWWDLRGTLSLEQLLGVIVNLQGIICLDSGILHIATSLDIPCIAIFGGVEPRLRVRESSRVIVLKSKLDCCPCNKNETCQGQYTCMLSINHKHVLDIINLIPNLQNIGQRAITAV